MMTIFKTNINWTKLAIAFVLLFFAFSFSSTAQTNPDKPLDTKSLAALVEELKGVVSRTTPDANEAAMVSKRWNARRDLAGKSKRAVINLLFEDVKSVIKDSGTQYQINSIFGMYKQMPDEAIATETPKTNSNMSKPAAVNKLIDLTYRMHPHVGYLRTPEGEPRIKGNEAAEEDRKSRNESFDVALGINNKLTAAQKSFVKANYDQLMKITNKITADAVRTNFPTEQWVKEGLQKSYTNKFTPTELNSLIAYFQANAGQQVLKYIRISTKANRIAENNNELNFTEADKTEYNKFAATPLGKKFNAAYLEETILYELDKENAVWSANPNANGLQIYFPSNLNNLFNKFVAENYKK